MASIRFFNKTSGGRGSTAHGDHIRRSSTGLSGRGARPEAQRGSYGTYLTSESRPYATRYPCRDGRSRRRGESSRSGLAGRQQRRELGVRRLTEGLAKRGDPEQGSLRGVPFHAGPHGTPLLDGAIAYLECKVADVLPGGDHDLFVGEALGGEILRADAAPLLFFRGRYRKIGA